MTAVAQLNDVSVTYGGRRGQVRAVNHVDVTVGSGGSIGIVGESGSGKSTLGKALLGLLPRNTAVSGQVWLGDTQLVDADSDAIRSLRWTYAAIVFQDAMSALNPVIRVGNQIRDVARLRMGLDKHEAEGLARRLLEKVGIEADRYHSFPHELSGGQRQRVMIAMAISCNPAILVADEPTTALDVVVQAEILELLNSLKKDLGLALVFISHDLGAVSQVADELLVMYEGQIVESGPIDQVIGNRSHPYTRALINSFPQIDGGEVEALPPRDPGAGSAASSSCRFASRCPLSDDICWNKAPELVDTGHSTQARCHFVGVHFNGH